MNITPSNPSGAPQSVMIVDDEPHVLIMVAGMLRKAGFMPIAAESAEMALAMIEGLRRESMLPAAILSDMRMAGLGGAGFIECLWADPATSGIPVILVTGRVDSPEDRSTPNVQGIVRKPFNRQALLGELQRVLDLGRHRPREAA